MVSRVVPDAAMPSRLSIVHRALAPSLALLLVLTGCGTREPAADEQRVTFHFVPQVDRFPSRPAPEPEHGGGSGGVSLSGGLDLGGMCGNDGRAALVVLGVVVAVVVIVVVADLTVDGIRKAGGTSYRLRLVQGTREVVLPLRTGTNHLNLHRGLIDGIAAGTVTADIMASGRRKGCAPFVPRLSGGMLRGW